MKKVTHREALRRLTNIVIDALDQDGRRAILERENALGNGMTTAQWRMAILRNEDEVYRYIVK